MSLLHYIDNEAPWDGDFGEWDARVQAGGAAIVRDATSAFPERGSYGLHMTSSTPNAAYMEKDLNVALAPGSSLYVALWFRLIANHTTASGLYPITCEFTAGWSDLRLFLCGDGDAVNKRRLALASFNDAGVSQSAGYMAFVPARWVYLVCRLQRASTSAAADGRIDLYVDGALRGSVAGIDNFDRMATAATVRIGNYSTLSGVDLYLDEVKVAVDEYPEPYRPAPADDHPCARRTVVLFRPESLNDTDSGEFADYCAGQIGVPRGLLVPLPNASGTETLAHYATFQTQVEDDLSAWLALNTDAADRVTTFLIGCGVPGYFDDGGMTYSAVSRLMNFGNAFSSQTANPLYGPATVTRPTVSDLRSAGVYLATRIDAPSLEQAKTVVDRAATVSGLTALNDSDTLYCDQADYRTSLAAQHLRIIRADLVWPLAGDAFVWGDTGTPSFGDAGSRAVFVDDSADSADTLRSTSCACGAGLFTGLYAAALGSADGESEFDPEGFLEMLRIGGTLAEAFATAARYVDGTAVAAGSPLMSVAFQTDGYNVYRGVGDVTGVDLDDPVAFLRADETNASLAGLGHSASAQYTYVVRPVRGDELVTPDLSCRAEFGTDADGDWVGARPATVDFIEATVAENGKIALTWGYTTPHDGSAPADFGVYYSMSSAIVPGSPDATVSYTTDKTYSIDLSLADGLTYWLAVTARSAEGVESHLSEVIGPFVAKATPPAAPAVYARSEF